MLVISETGTDQHDSEWEACAAVGVDTADFDANTLSVPVAFEDQCLLGYKIHIGVQFVLAYFIHVSLCY